MVALLLSEFAGITILRRGDENTWVVILRLIIHSLNIFRAVAHSIETLSPVPFGSYQLCTAPFVEEAI